jgi:hydroxymethylpyrimidine/phosphomethylpyrimidine kinase
MPEEHRIAGFPPRIALTIAGLDPSSGAGITADLKTFAAHDLYGICCATALTVQSTQGVKRTIAVEGGMVAETLGCLAEDMEIDGVKIGMLGTGDVANAVVEFLLHVKVPRSCVVLDPVLRSSSGAVLLDEAGLRVVQESLLGFIGWVTPNLDELSILAAVGNSTATRETLPGAAHALREKARHFGNEELNVVVTGGHLERPDDYFLEAKRESGVWVGGERVETTSTHGTGCAFSSALLAQLLHGKVGVAAVSGAKQYVTEALRDAYPVGKGHGPMNHLYRLKPGG